MPYAQPDSPTLPFPALARTRQSWWRRPWIAPLLMVVIAFLAFSLPPYLSLDPRRSRIQPPGSIAGYFPILVAHVVFGSVALLAACLQVWPWFRQRYRVAHRIAGRVYVFGGVLPAGLLGLTLGAFTPFGPMLRVSNVMLALLWLTFTVTGYRMARQRRYVEHRRWMIRSFALTASIITNRIWGVIAFLVLTPQLHTTFGGNETMLAWTIAGLAGWLGWVVSLLIA